MGVVNQCLNPLLPVVLTVGDVQAVRRLKVNFTLQHILSNMTIIIYGIYSWYLLLVLHSFYNFAQCRKTGLCGHYMQTYFGS